MILQGWHGRIRALAFAGQLKVWEDQRKGGKKAERRQEGRCRAARRQGMGNLEVGGWGAEGGLRASSYIIQLVLPL